MSFNSQAANIQIIRIVNQFNTTFINYQLSIMNYEFIKTFYSYNPRIRIP